MDNISDTVASSGGRPPLSLWGGVECTLNRVGDVFTDQAARSGHAERRGDLEAFAELGLKTLRVPILWEQVSPGGATPNWERSDAQMARLRTLHVTPIVGLVHHGSGPASTDLLDEGFATGLAAHAAQAAARYPWVTLWTPVNEPLTTARFSCLYGLWYPHQRDERAFWAALLNQVDATIAAMAAIRQIVPTARLVQTDDLGRTYATEPLAPQADFDNERRWAGWDLLCGRIVPGHALWNRLRDFGLTERLERIAIAPCPPEIIGINHYLTSDRFLDDRVELYPPDVRGLCSFGPVADVEAVRAVLPAPAGIEGALRDACARYGLPVALTEVHLGCTREEQLRWLSEAWETAARLRGEGLDIVAVTAWSLLGAFDWASLLTRPDGLYESGLYDVSAGGLRPTALAAMVADLAVGNQPRHRFLAQAGWWRQPGRFDYPPHRLGRDRTAPRLAHRPAMSGAADPGTAAESSGPLLILGASGTLGQAFAGACRLRAIPYRLTSRAELALDAPDQIDALLGALRPWAVINATGWVRVDEAECDPDACRAVNRDGALALAAACAARGLPLTNFSSDLVFDGAADRPYVEGDRLAPLSVYGASKAEADQRLLAMPDILVIRTASFFSPYDRHNFASQVVGCLRAGDRFRAAEDVVTSPTFVPDLVRIALDLMIDGETGLWHLANAGALSWADFARAIAVACALDPELIDGVPQAEMGWAASRPAQAALASRRSGLMPTLADAIARFAAVA